MNIFKMQRFHSGILSYPFSGWVLVFAETGIIGLIFYFVIFYISQQSGFRQIKYKSIPVMNENEEK
jgi:hypothetical protein